MCDWKYMDKKTHTIHFKTTKYFSEDIIFRRLVKLRQSF